MKVRRSNLIQDVVEKVSLLLKSSKDCFADIRVLFDGETGVDAGYA